MHYSLMQLLITSKSFVKMFYLSWCFTIRARVFAKDELTRSRAMWAIFRYSFFFFINYYTYTVIWRGYKERRVAHHAMRLMKCVPLIMNTRLMRKMKPAVETFAVPHYDDTFLLHITFQNRTIKYLCTLRLKNLLFFLMKLSFFLVFICLLDNAGILRFFNFINH